MVGKEGYANQLAGFFLIFIFLVVVGLPSCHTLSGGQRHVSSSRKLHQPPSQLRRTPPMGFNSWAHFSGSITAELLLSVADAMKGNGLLEAGYNFLNCDDGWAWPNRSAASSDGKIAPNPHFVNGSACKADASTGLRPLGDALHKLGFKFGIYSAAGMTTCNSLIGSLYHERSDAKTFVSWGVDYLKYDDCGEANLQSYARYMVMHDALQDAVSSSSSNHFRRNDAITYSYEPYCWHCHSPVTYLQWVPSVGDTWRSGGDIRDTWVSVLGNAIENNRWAHLARPGHQNDADMLEIGNGGLNDLEEESHFALWCLIKSPLLLAGDPRTMTAHSIAVVTNKRLLAVSADPLGIQGTLRSAAAYGANASQAALAAKIYAMQARASAQSAAESYRAAVSHAASAVAPFVAPCTYAEGGRREAKVHRNGSRLTLNHGDTLSDRSPLPSQQWILADNGTIMQLKQDGSYLCLERAVSNGSVYATGCVSGNDAPSLSGIVNSSSGNGHSDGDGADKVGSLLSSTAAAQRQMWYTGRANETLSQIRVPSISRGNTFYDKTRDTFAEHNDEASSGGQCLAFDGVHLGIKPCAVEPAACATSRCKYSALVEQLWYRSAHGQLISSFTAFSGAPPVPPQVRHSPWRRRRKYLLNHHRRRRIVASLPENMPWCLATEKSPPPKVIEPPLAVDASLPRQVWAVPLVDGSVAAVLLNAGNVTHNVTASWSALGLSSGTGASVMDLWTGENTTISAGGGDAITLTLRPHQCAALRLTEQRHPSRGRSNIR